MRRSSISSLTAEDITLNLDALGTLSTLNTYTQSSVAGRASADPRVHELQHDVALLIGQNHALLQRVQQLAVQVSWQDTLVIMSSSSSLKAC